LFKMTPLTSTRIQLQSKKKNPIEIDGESTTSASALSVALDKVENPPPNPMRMLNTGPAKQAVMAMFARPFFAIVMFAERSPMEFPQAKTVRPIMEPGMRKIAPKNTSKLTNWSAIASIHVAAITKP